MYVPCMYVPTCIYACLVVTCIYPGTFILPYLSVSSRYLPMNTSIASNLPTSFRLLFLLLLLLLFTFLHHCTPLLPFRLHYCPTIRFTIFKIPTEQSRGVCLSSSIPEVADHGPSPLSSFPWQFPVILHHRPRMPADQLLSFILHRRGLQIVFM
jgi:hypothetical protein